MSLLKLHTWKKFSTGILNIGENECQDFLKNKYIACLKSCTDCNVRILVIKEVKMCSRL